MYLSFVKIILLRVIAILFGLGLAFFVLSVVLADVPPGLRSPDMTLVEYVQISAGNVMPFIVAYGVIGAVLGFVKPSTSWRWSLWLVAPIGIIFAWFGIRLWLAGILLSCFITASLGASFASRYQVIRGHTR